MATRWYRAPELLVGDPAYGKEVNNINIVLIKNLILDQKTLAVFQKILCYTSSIVKLRLGSGTQAHSGSLRLLLRLTQALTQ